MKKPIIERDIATITSASDKVLRDNLSRVHLGKLANWISSWTSENIKLMEEYSKSPICKIHNEYWAYLFKHREEKDKLKKERKKIRIVEW